MLPAVIASIEQAFREIKGFSIDAWEGEYRTAARVALKEILEIRMKHWVDRTLQELQARDVSDRRNGYFSRHLLTEVGDLELSIARTRTFSAIGILRQVAGGLGRQAGHVERMILLAFALGLSTRKVGRALLPILGEKVSASTVSAVAKQLDKVVEAYHRRPLLDRYEVLVLDGVVLKRKTGVGAQKRPVLVALGIRPDGKREVIDFRQAFSESQAEWEGFLDDLYRRGLKGECLKLIVTDGGKGLKAALPLVFGQVPVHFAGLIRHATSWTKSDGVTSTRSRRISIRSATRATSSSQHRRRHSALWPNGKSSIPRPLPASSAICLSS